MTSTEQQRVEEIAGKLSPADRRNMVRTPHPQPLPGRWLFAGSVAEAWRLAELGLLDRAGFTPDGLAVRTHIMSLIERRVDCPTCGAKGLEPCRVLSHRDERERPDHAARRAAALRARAQQEQTI